MRCTLWHEMAEKHAGLTVGKTYYIGRGQLKVANRQYMQVDNQYEMSLNASCVPSALPPLPPCLGRRCYARAVARLSHSAIRSTRPQSLPYNSVAHTQEPAVRIAVVHILWIPSSPSN
jgi:hypothetical protein